MSAIGSGSLVGISKKLQNSSTNGIFWSLDNLEQATKQAEKTRIRNVILRCFKIVDVDGTKSCEVRTKEQFIMSDLCYSSEICSIMKGALR